MRHPSLLSVVFCALMAAAAHGQAVVVKPYVQHGDTGALGTTDNKVIAWTVESEPPAEWVAEYRVGDAGEWRRAEITSTKLVARKSNPPKPKDAGEVVVDPPHDYRWLMQRADVRDLPLGSKVAYRVKQNGSEIGSGVFSARKARDGAIDFIVVGDTAKGTPEQKQIAFAMSQVKPEFIVSTGDIVYDNGRISEFLSKFWPVYVNTDRADAKTGAPLLRDAVFYPCIGNHDIQSSDFGQTPDALGAFYFFYTPLNDLKLKGTLVPKGNASRIERFKQTVGGRFPSMLNYSFSNGPAHFLVLDANKYVNINEGALRDFVEADLAAAKDAPWKFVVYHQPAFSNAKKHFEEQRFRGLSPLFEKHGVDVVFTGHVHNYQRSRPIKYVPKLDAKGLVQISKEGMISGELTVDKTFDGKSDTTPEGIIYIVTGGGGASLHSKFGVGDTDEAADDKSKATTMPKKDDSPKISQAAKEEAVEFMDQFIGDRHSFTRVQLTPRRCTITQLDAKMKDLDQIVITK